MAYQVNIVCQYVRVALTDVVKFSLLEVRVICVRANSGGGGGEG